MDPRPGRSPYREPPPPCKHRWGSIWRYLYDSRKAKLDPNYEGLQQCEKCSATRATRVHPLDYICWLPAAVVAAVMLMRWLLR